MKQNFLLTMVNHHLDSTPICLSMIELVIILLFKDNVLELSSKRTYIFFFLFKGDFSIHPEKGDLSSVDEEMLLVCSKRKKDNDDISNGQIL